MSKGHREEEFCQEHTSYMRNLFCIFNHPSRRSGNVLSPYFRTQTLRLKVGPEPGF
jgi:hypothetical protein